MWKKHYAETTAPLLAEVQKALGLKYTLSKWTSCDILLVLWSFIQFKFVMTTANDLWCLKFRSICHQWDKFVTGKNRSPFCNVERKPFNYSFQKFNILSFHVAGFFLWIHMNVHYIYTVSSVDQFVTKIRLQGWVSFSAGKAWTVKGA